MALSPKQAKCLELMATGLYTDKEISGMIKISQQSICKWKKDPEFKHAYTEYITNRIQYAASKAFKKQERLLESKVDMVAHLAAKDLMDRAGFKPEDRVALEADMELNINIDYGDEE